MLSYFMLLSENSCGGWIVKEFRSVGPIQMTRPVMKPLRKLDRGARKWNMLTSRFSGGKTTNAAARYRGKLAECDRYECWKERGMDIFFQIKHWDTNGQKVRIQILPSEKQDLNSSDAVTRFDCIYSQMQEVPPPKNPKYPNTDTCKIHITVIKVLITFHRSRYSADAASTPAMITWHVTDGLILPHRMDPMKPPTSQQTYGCYNLIREGGGVGGANKRKQTGNVGKRSGPACLWWDEQQSSQVTPAVNKRAHMSQCRICCLAQHPRRAADKLCVCVCVNNNNKHLYSLSPRPPIYTLTNYG